MFTPYFSLLSLLLITTLFLSGCTIKPTPNLQNNVDALTAEQRTSRLVHNKKWQLQGKIAFIQKLDKEKDKRESASIIWQVDEEKQTQTLSLNSYLGINVLHLSSNQNQHLIKVDGEEYQGTNLPQLIYVLTGLTLPTKALNFWLKGLPYNANDDIKLDKTSQLPISISSYYHNILWKINYHNYKNFDGIAMATKFTIKKENLVIKIVVNNWSFVD